MTFSNDVITSLAMPVQKITTFRRILPQIIATTIKNLHIIDVGLVFAMPSIVIPAVTGLPNEHNRSEFISMTDTGASWISSIACLLQAFGSLISGFISDPLGRKWTMVIMNIPFAIGWFMLYRATESYEIFIAFAILGMAYGLVEGPISTYVGEISEPKIRSIMIGYSNITGTASMLIIYVLNILMPWRTVALVIFTLPLITAVMLLLVPETPQWLLSKNRTQQAEKSLCWLRGWVPAQSVTQEFAQLQQHSRQSKSCSSCIKEDIKCMHPLPTFGEKLSELKRPQNLKPFAIIFALCFLMQFTGVYTMRAYIVPIFEAYGCPIPSDQAATYLSLTDNLGNLIYIILISFTGKRRLFLTVTTGVFLSCLVITCYGFMVLPPGFTSFNQQHQPYQLDNPNLAFIPMICLYLWSFFSYAGCLEMPWIMLSELFPFKSRVISTGIAISFNYIIAFISRKTYFNLETTLSLPGTTLFYTVICGCGLILMYFILPETEGRSLEDIERHFSDNSKKLTDRQIARSTVRPSTMQYK